MPIYPQAKIQVPISLRLQGNGKLKTDQLAPTLGGGAMYKYAAVAFNFMYDNAKKDGIELNNWGTYRPYDRQVAIFVDRYREYPTGRDPVITAQWQGRTWWLRKTPPAVPCAVPGTSPHGWGMAIDVNPEGPRLEWLRQKCPLYGFGWETQDNSKYWEPWHIVYAKGSSYTMYVSTLIDKLFPN